MVNCCAGFGIVFAWAALILMIFGQVGQLGTSVFPRHLRIIAIDTAGVAKALSSAARQSGISVANVTTSGNFSDVYSTQPIGKGYFSKDANETYHGGLRKTYEWGLYSYCTTNGDLGAPRSYCVHSSIHNGIDPVAVLLQDAPTKYDELLKSIIPRQMFDISNNLDFYTNRSSIVILVATITTFLAAILGLFSQRGGFFFAAFFNIISALMLSAGLAMYQILYSGLQNYIDAATSAGVDVGVSLLYGNAMAILWAANALLYLSIVPYVVACCTGRKTTVKA
ncbi:hypothetical protein JCM10908_002207 [Rhodotorula pacifica]|uniref:uncharacterized protein n=1 Tax=Rhodotorula pacifica TaxID=1495444 RepID=UPI00317C4414